MRRGWLVFMCLAGLSLNVGCQDSPPPKPTSQAASPPEKSPHPQTDDLAEAAALVAAHRAQEQSPAAAEALGVEVDLEAIRLTGTDKWVRKQPRSTFVRAEFALPKAEGDAQDGRLTVSTAGGTIQDNLDRWRKQFGGQPTKESKDELEVAGTKITVVDFSGTYADQAGPFAPAVERAGYRMLGAVIPVKGELYFVKAYGPEKTMAAQTESFRAFLKTLKVK